MPLATDSNPNSNKRGMGEDPQNALKVNIAGVEARLRVATATAEQLLKVATDGADDRAELHFKLYVEERRHCADLAAELDELKTGLTALSPQEEHHRGDADDEEEEEEERLVKKPRTAHHSKESVVQDSEHGEEGNFSDADEEHDNFLKTLTQRAPSESTLASPVPRTPPKRGGGRKPGE